jgi:hypothetical protein
MNNGRKVHIEKLQALIPQWGMDLDGLFQRK